MLKRFNKCFSRGKKKRRMSFFVTLFSREIFKRQNSQEEHGRWQTSLANTNNNFTNPTNLLLLSPAYWIDTGIYYFSTFPPPPSNLYFPRDSAVHWFLFSLLKSYHWFLIPKCPHNKVIESMASGVRKSKMWILAYQWLAVSCKESCLTLLSLIFLIWKMYIVFVSGERKYYYSIV